MQIKNMETIVGMDNVMGGVQNANSRIELQSKENAQDLNAFLNLVKSMKTTTDSEYSSYVKIGVLKHIPEEGEEPTNED